MNDDLNPRSSILIHVTSALAAFHILETGKMKCSSNKDRPYKLMLGEGIYFADNMCQAAKKSNHRNVPQGRAIIVSIVNLGNTFETFYKEKALTKEKVDKYGYNSVLCYKLNTGNEYCVFEVDRVLPLFAKIQFPEETYYLMGTPSGVMKLKQFPIDNMMIKMTCHQIIFTDSNNNPFYVIPHEEPQLTNKLLIFTHVRDFYFSKVIHRLNDLTLTDVTQLNGDPFDGSEYSGSFAGNELLNEEEDMNEAIDEYDDEEEEDLSLTSRYKRREKPVDIVFVIDATSSAKNILIAMISKMRTIIGQISTEFPNFLIYCGAVIYRDPVDSNSTQTAENTGIEDRVAKLKSLDVTSRHLSKNLTDDEYDYDDDDYILNDYSNMKYDMVKYPVDKNAVIDLAHVYISKFPNVYNFSNGLGSLVAELGSVRSAGGNGQPEDWAGALQILLEDVSWRRDSSKLVVWIAEANCGVKNEEDELAPLVQRLIQKRASFVGINAAKDGGCACKRTIDQIKAMYDESGGLKFAWQEMRQAGSDWTRESVDNFAETVIKNIARALT